MKHTLTINNKNKTEHIIHLDQKQIPLTIKQLPKNTAYQIQNTPILTTTTQTLHKQNPRTIRQKNKQITQPTLLIIIQNTITIPTTQIKTIQEHPQIKTHMTTKENLHITLKQIINNNTPPTNKKTTIQENKKRYTLYHDTTPIKTYKNQEYTKHITKILNTQPQLTLQEAEYQAQKKYYKHISYDKTNQTYKITLQQKTISTHKKLRHAIEERNIQTQKQEPEEETLCQTTPTPIQPLPPTPWNNKLHHTRKEHNKYLTNNTQKTKHYNPDTTTHIQNKKTKQTTILNTQKPNRNITKTKNTYTIIKKQDKKLNKYYQTNNKTLARYIRDKLEENQYDTTRIKQYKQQYKHDKKEYKQIYQAKHDIIDYYQNTSTRLTQTDNIKEEYQTRQIQKTRKTNTRTSTTTRHQ